MFDYDHESYIFVCSSKTPTTFVLDVSWQLTTQCHIINKSVVLLIQGFPRCDRLSVFVCLNKIVTI